MAEPTVQTRAMSLVFPATAFLLALAALPILLPIMLIFRIYRTVLANKIHAREGDKVDLVSGDDSVWLQDSAENRAIINALMLLRGTPDIGKFCDVVKERLVDASDPDNPNVKLFPKITKFTTKILHRYVWQEDESFDMKNHVVLHPEPAPSDKAGLERLVGELCSRPLAPHRPAWQFVLLSPGPEDPQHGQIYYGVFRAHHSIADGISLVRMMMQKLVDKEPQSKGSSPRYGTKNVIQMVVRAVVEGPALLLSRLVRPADRNIIHGPELSGTKLVSWSDPIDLALVKQIKSATGTTVNDVIIGALASTFREYFKIHASEIPDNMLAYIPVDIRPASASIRLGNQFALVFLDLPLDEDDPVKLLRKTKSRMDHIKASPEPIVNAYTIKYFMNRFPNWVTKFFFDFAASKSSLIVSNVPGPQDTLSLAGDQIEAMVFWPPQKTNVGLGASVFSYRDTIRVGIFVDKSIMTTPRVLVDGFLRSIQKLKDSVDVSREE